MRRLERKVGKKSLDRELFLLRSHNFNSFRFTSTSTALPANWNWFSTAEMGFCSIKFHSKMFVIKYFHNTYIYLRTSYYLNPEYSLPFNWIECSVSYDVLIEWSHRCYYGLKTANYVIDGILSITHLWIYGLDCVRNGCERCTLILSPTVIKYIVDCASAEETLIEEVGRMIVGFR